MAAGHKSRKYSPRLRAFALTLHFYSPRAYSYVRSVFENRLPCVSTIRKWYTTINGKPGFSQEAFNVLKMRANRANTNGDEILTCLIFDEMSIRQQEEYDHHKDEKVGFVNYGTVPVNSKLDQLAKHAFVFMVVGINDKFKIPVAYFLTCGLKSGEKAAIIQQVILFVCKTGVKVVGMTFDGLIENLATCMELGADFKENMGYFINPHSDEQIFLFLDACHMLKLARNCLASKKILYDGDGGLIEWRFIEALEQYQRENKVNVGNKINKCHIQWNKNKMCVRVASQTLSNSTADSIDLLRRNGVDGFENSEATTKYIRFVNNTFDILNSKVDDAIGFKRTISLETKEEFFNYFAEVRSYFRKLKLESTGKKTILQTRSKTPFFGFILCFDSFEMFFNKYVESNVLKSIPTFRFSQDHLELLFGCIRKMFGCNDNPSAKHIESAWRKLLGQHQITASDAGNCANNDIEMLNVLNVSSRATNVKSVETPINWRICDRNSNVLLDEDELAEKDELWLLNSILDEDDSSSNIEKHAIFYMASVLEECILQGKWYKSIKCEKCLIAFREDGVTDDIFVTTKMKTNNLHAPARSTVIICATTEKLLQACNYEAGNYNKISNGVLLNLDPESLFATSDFRSHADTNHKIVLVRMIIEMYVKKRLEYISKLNTLDKHNVLYRQFLKKLVHFHGQ